MIFAISILVICSIDLFVKNYVEKHSEELEHKKLMNGKIIINKVHNKGMMLNAFEKYTQMVRYSSLVAGIILLLYYIQLLSKKGFGLKKIGVTFMLGGAVSNIYDRLVRGYVIDYFSINTKWEKLKTIVFNIGDICIFLGGLMVIISHVFSSITKSFASETHH